MAAWTKGQASMGLAIGISVGFTMILLACALPKPSAWWPLFALSPWFLAPIPWVFANSFEKYSGEVSTWEMFGHCMGSFLMTGMFGLPLVMAHVKVITGTATILTCLGQLVALGSIGYFSKFLREEPLL